MSLEVIILAAGRGTRMQAELPKVLLPVGGKPMLEHVVDTARALQPAGIHVVVGADAEPLRTALPQADLNWIVQEQQQGTGHAVGLALAGLDPEHGALVLYGDVPLIEADSLRELLELPRPALLTAVLADPGRLGRVVRGREQEFLQVVEYADASEQQRQITEINSGVLAAGVGQLQGWLPGLGRDNRQGEYYLPDVLALARREGLTVHTLAAATQREVLGVNDRAELHQVEREYQFRLASALLEQGVGLADARRLDVRGSLTAGSGVFIDANVLLEGEVVLGDGVRIGPNCVLRNVQLGDGVQVLAFSHLEDTRAEAGCEIGPYARLRPGTRLAARASIGNFVEVTRSDIGQGTKVRHLTYLGDSEVGAEANIGAGAITCNYDGAGKHKTRIGRAAFVGSNATLIAPLEVADGAFVGAGSTISKDVGEDELAVSRPRQRNLRGWQSPAARGKGKPAKE